MDVTHVKTKQHYLDELPVKAGQLIFVEDNGDMYLDSDDTTRQKLGRVEEIAGEYVSAHDSDAKAHEELFAAAAQDAKAKAEAAEQAAKEASRPATWTPNADDVGARADTWVPGWEDVTGKPGTFPPSGHSHSKSEITDFPASLPPTAHTHGAGEITSGTLSSARLPTVPVTKGGTGATTAAAARTALGACAAFGPVLVTVDVSAWAGAGPWTQTVSVAGVTAADNGIGVYPVDVADADARKLYETAYGCLAAEAETVAGGVKLTCRDAKPETSFQIKVQGVR